MGSREAMAKYLAFPRLELSREIQGDLVPERGELLPFPKARAHTQAWFTQKQGALACALLFLISWSLTVGLLPQPFSVFNWVAYFWRSRGA